MSDLVIIIGIFAFLVFIGAIDIEAIVDRICQAYENRNRKD